MQVETVAKIASALIGLCMIIVIAEFGFFSMQSNNDNQAVKANTTPANTSTHDDFFDPTNPLSPLSPANPINPASPSRIYMSSRIRMR